MNARSGNMGRLSQRVTAGMFSSLRRAPVMAVPERRYETVYTAAREAGLDSPRCLTCAPPRTRCGANSSPFDSIPPIMVALAVALISSGPMTTDWTCDHE